MPAARPFDRFIVLAGMRTGSNFLEDNLNAVPGLACHGEAFNPQFIGRKDRTEYLGVTLARREEDPFALLAAIEAATAAERGGIAGFRFFHDHDPRVLDRCLADRRCAKVILSRNPLDAFVSLQIARATGQWRLGDVRRRRVARVAFDPAAFAEYLAAQTAFHARIRRTLQATGQAPFGMRYEDLADLEVLNGLAAFLGAPGRLAAVSQEVRKQNPEPVIDKVTNPEAMAAALAGLDPFGLSDLPGFEPGRGAAVPSFVAARGAPVLWLPIQGGPAAGPRAWLAALARPDAAPGLGEGFTRRALHEWQAANPGARAFTVLRHPLARADAAFRARILTGAAGEVAGALRRKWKLDLPPPDRAAALPAAAHRALLLGFLRFLKGNLAGQTGLRVDAAWASQAAVLDGFATAIRPDHILREDRLAQGLAFLAAGTGASAPPPPPEPAPPGPPLAAIADAEIEAAARDACARDYQAFGFGNWGA